MIEQFVLDEVRKRMSSVEQLRYLLEKIKYEISNLFSDIPELIQRTESELRSEIVGSETNLISLVKEKEVEHLAKRCWKTKKKIDALQTEFDGLRQTCDKIFQTPPIEWIEERLPNSENCLRLTPTTQLWFNAIC